MYLHEYFKKSGERGKITISYGEALEQPFLFSYCGDHGKSKGEGLTQAKPTTCLKELGTSFNKLHSKKWCTPVLSIWEAGDRKISKAVIRHSSGTRRALWPQTASDSSQSQQDPSQHRVIPSTLFSIPPPQAWIAAGRRLQAILPQYHPLLPCYGTAALMPPISTLTPAPENDFPSLRSPPLLCFQVHAQNMAMQREPMHWALR